MKEVTVTVILFVVSIGALVLSFYSFKEKGFLINNAYIYATKKERNSMDKKPHYRQSAIVFFLISIMFLLIAIEVLLDIRWILYVVLAVIAVTIFYAIVSSILIETKKK
ncbi:DUF3784 domain-containing protein [Alkaliphilus serpentinus]|uniref:DUF3784 domain-containing protein n=1 Tax=Alkaliphilus serpentinus TaxID=1482731 RepID=A0A833HMA9_9FIRM|nr:DUF3784 domain-containing protein [Alkaliphilus serpentinus]KAB3527291.1 DUF3784 domain-containing protein [Alkaliphilus serpentinus]